MRIPTKTISKDSSKPRTWELKLDDSTSHLFTEEVVPEGPDCFYDSIGEDRVKAHGILLKAKKNALFREQVLFQTQQAQSSPADSKSQQDPQLSKCTDLSKLYFDIKNNTQIDKDLKEVILETIYEEYIDFLMEPQDWNKCLLEPESKKQDWSGCFIKIAEEQNKSLLICKPIKEPEDETPGQLEIYSSYKTKESAQSLEIAIYYPDHDAKKMHFNRLVPLKADASYHTGLVPLKPEVLYHTYKVSIELNQKYKKLQEQRQAKIEEFRTAMLQDKDEIGFPANVYAKPIGEIEVENATNALKNGKATDEDYLTLAHDAYKNKKFKEAIHYSTQSIKIRRNQFGPHLLRGGAYFEIGQYHQAAFNFKICRYIMELHIADTADMPIFWKRHSYHLLNYLDEVLKIYSLQNLLDEDLKKLENQQTSLLQEKCRQNVIKIARGLIKAELCHSALAHCNQYMDEKLLENTDTFRLDLQVFQMQAKIKTDPESAEKEIEDFVTVNNNQLSNITLFNLYCLLLENQKDYKARIKICESFYKRFSYSDENWKIFSYQVDALFENNSERLRLLKQYLPQYENKIPPQKRESLQYTYINLLLENKEYKNCLDYCQWLLSKPLSQNHFKFVEKSQFNALIELEKSKREAGGHPEIYKICDLILKREIDEAFNLFSKFIPKAELNDKDYKIIREMCNNAFNSIADRDVSSESGKFNTLIDYFAKRNAKKTFDKDQKKDAAAQIEKLSTVKDEKVSNLPQTSEKIGPLFTFSLTCKIGKSKPAYLQPIMNFPSNFPITKEKLDAFKLISTQIENQEFLPALKSCTNQLTDLYKLGASKENDGLFLLLYLLRTTAYEGLIAGKVKDFKNYGKDDYLDDCNDTITLMNKHSTIINASWVKIIYLKNAVKDALLGNYAKGGQTIVSLLRGESGIPKALIQIIQNYFLSYIPEENGLQQKYAKNILFNPDEIKQESFGPVSASIKNTKGKIETQFNLIHKSEWKEHDNILSPVRDLFSKEITPSLFDKLIEYKGLLTKKIEELATKDEKSNLSQPEAAIYVVYLFYLDRIYQNAGNLYFEEKEWIVKDLTRDKIPFYKDGITNLEKARSIVEKYKLPQLWLEMLDILLTSQYLHIKDVGMAYKYFRPYDVPSRDPVITFFQQYPEIANYNSSISLIETESKDEEVKEITEPTNPLLSTDSALKAITPIVSDCLECDEELVSEVKDESINDTFDSLIKIGYEITEGSYKHKFGVDLLAIISAIAPELVKGHERKLMYIFDNSKKDFINRSEKLLSIAAVKFEQIDRFDKQLAENIENLLSIQVKLNVQTKTFYLRFFHLLANYLRHNQLDNFDRLIKNYTDYLKQYKPDTFSRFYEIRIDNLFLLSFNEYFSEFTKTLSFEGRPFKNLCNLIKIYSNFIETFWNTGSSNRFLNTYRIHEQIKEFYESSLEARGIYDHLPKYFKEGFISRIPEATPPSYTFNDKSLALYNLLKNVDFANFSQESAIFEPGDFSTQIYPVDFHKKLTTQKDIYGTPISLNKFTQYFDKADLEKYIKFIRYDFLRKLVITRLDISKNKLLDTILQFLTNLEVDPSFHSTYELYDKEEYQKVYLQLKFKKLLTTSDYCQIENENVNLKLKMEFIKDSVVRIEMPAYQFFGNMIANLDQAILRLLKTTTSIIYNTINEIFALKGDATPLPSDISGRISSLIGSYLYLPQPHLNHLGLITRNPGRFYRSTFSDIENKFNQGEASQNDATLIYYECIKYLHFLDIEYEQWPIQINKQLWKQGIPLNDKLVNKILVYLHRLFELGNILHTKFLLNAESALTSSTPEANTVGLYPPITIISTCSDLLLEGMGIDYNHRNKIIEEDQKPTKGLQALSTLFKDKKSNANSTPPQRESEQLISMDEGLHRASVGLDSA